MKSAAMRHTTLLNSQYRMLLIASLMSSCLLMGCALHLERFYKPAASVESAPAVLQPSATAPQLAYSRDPDRDGVLLRQRGYVLIGTTSFYGAADLSFAEHAAVQGQKVGAAIVLLESSTYILGGDAPLGNPARAATYFASYWAKSAENTRSN
jgi:hypothetical protein